MDASPSTVPPNPKQFGHIPGVPVGTWFRTRKELLEAGVHGMIRAGIHGSQVCGAYSICISGGYEDNEDSGDRIVYVGSGGRNDETRRQVMDQSLYGHGNKALHISYQTKNPVRLIRGKDEYNPHAPYEGYRYDGLFIVDSAKPTKGKAGYDVWRFELSKYTEEVPRNPESNESN